MELAQVPVGKNMGRCDGTLSVAPMLAISNTHFRNFLRCLTRRTQLWTEMVTDQAVLHNPEGLQDNLRGCNPSTLAQAAKYVEELGFDEINLNVGCPSSRVVNEGGFGAALMRTPEVVRDIVYQIKRQVQIPVTVKTRIGYDHSDSQEFLTNFIKTVAAGGCDHFVVHARKAWLKGVDPKKNRALPPLRYDRCPATCRGKIEEQRFMLKWFAEPDYVAVCSFPPRPGAVVLCFRCHGVHRVYDLCNKFPNLDFTLNGGVKTLKAAQELMKGEWPAGLEEEPNFYQLPATENVLKGVMIGRAAANDPCVLAVADSEFFGGVDPVSAASRRSVLEAYGHYLEERELARTASIHTAMKPVLGVFSGMPGQRLFRYTLDRLAREECRGCLPHEVLQRAVKVVDEAYPEVLDYPIRRGKGNRIG